ncbi:hypothetical protein BDQ17DRAFT_1355663 [Cyathus striatus]|nr:hypothetical protein BDQ17DRAFT_1355663 [Cyathus striatus]
MRLRCCEYEWDVGRICVMEVEGFMCCMCRFLFFFLFRVFISDFRPPFSPSVHLYGFLYPSRLLHLLSVFFLVFPFVPWVSFHLLFHSNI